MSDRRHPIAEAEMPEAPAAAALFARHGAFGIRTTTLRHPAAFAVREARRVGGRIPGAGPGNLAPRNRTGRLSLVAAAEDRARDLMMPPPGIGGQERPPFADADAMGEHLGVEPGSAFAVRNEAAGAATLELDEGLLRHDILTGNSSTGRAATSLVRADRLRFLEAAGHRPPVVRPDGELHDPTTNGEAS